MNKYKVTRKDIKNSPINYSFTEVAIKNIANKKSAYNINELQQENNQLKERIQNILEGKEIPAICAKKYEEYETQLAIRDKMIEIASENFIFYMDEKEHKKELKRQFAFWEKLAKENKI